MGNAFDNSNLKTGLCGGCDCTGFSPVVNFSYNSGAGTITITDATTYPSGADRKIVKIRVSDKDCKIVNGNILAADGDDAVTIDVSGLDLSEGFVINASVVSDDGCISDGHFGRIGMMIATGKLGSWDQDSTGIIISDVDATDDES
jgi:hypothetical protein